MGASAVLLLTFESTAILFVGLGIPLKRRKVRPNSLYGFRTAATLRDERLWYEVNERCGQDMIGLGLSLGVLAAAMFALELSVPAAALASSAWLVAGSMFMLLHGLLYIREQHRAR